MLVLEKKFYSLAEIKELMNVKRKETITNNLTKWNYHYEWIPRKGVNIIETPDINTPEEQLKSLLMRKLNLDVRADYKAFAAFFFKIIDDELFLTTPWETRAKIIGDEFGIEVTDRTLRKYNAKLVEKNIIIKDNSRYEYWYTTYVGSEKCQDAVLMSKEEEVEGLKRWIDKRKKYLEAADLEYSQAIGVAGSKNPDRWKIAMNKLWETTKVVYYKVKGWDFNAFEDTDLKEIYRLSALVMADIEIPEDAEEIIEEKVKFNPMEKCAEFNKKSIF